MSEAKMTVNVWLAGRSYRFSIRQEDESAVRKAIKVAEDRIAELKNSYAGKDDQDFIAMCLLMYAAESAITTEHDPMINDELQQMCSKIDKVLG
jgi:cell division protein ZapA